MNRTWIISLCAVGALLASTSSDADVVRSPPKDCPPGYTPGTGHSGPYCRPPKPTCPPKHQVRALRGGWYCEPPPRTDCPKEHVPKVRRRVAYCEPPPATQCPVGSYWTSRGPKDTGCQAGGWCEKDGDKCGKSGSCKTVGLCVESRYTGRRRSISMVKGVCKTDADCAGRARCRVQPRCDQPKRAAASSAAAAKPVASVVAPEPTPQKAVPVPKRQGLAATPWGLLLGVGFLILVILTLRFARRAA